MINRYQQGGTPNSNSHEWEDPNFSWGTYHKPGTSQFDAIPHFLSAFASQLGMLGGDNYEDDLRMRINQSRVAPNQGFYGVFQQGGLTNNFSFKLPLISQESTAIVRTVDPSYTSFQPVDVTVAIPSTPNTVDGKAPNDKDKDPRTEFMNNLEKFLRQKAPDSMDYSKIAGPTSSGSTSGAKSLSSEKLYERQQGGLVDVSSEEQELLRAMNMDSSPVKKPVRKEIMKAPSRNINKFIERETQKLHKDIMKELDKKNPDPVKLNQLLLKKDMYQSHFIPDKSKVAGESGVQLQKGGLLNASSMLSQLGYSDGSPFRNMNSINIQGDTITMKNTGMPLLLETPDGRQKVATPYSGTYRFPGASSVRETPIMRYQQGGPVQGPQEPPQNIPIQTEKGEMILHADGSITPVLAKKLHKHMDPNVVTDILPEGTFIASDHKPMSIHKDSILNLSFGFGPLVYKEDGSGSQVQEVKFADLFGNQKKMTPAALAKKIQKKYPMSERENDAFAHLAREENRESRVPFLQTLAAVAEDQKEQGPIQVFQQGGLLRKFQGGGYTQDWGGASAYGGAITGFIGSLIQMIDANARRDELLSEAKDMLNIQNANLGKGTIAGAASLIAQDPTSDRPNLDPSIQVIRDRMSQAPIATGQIIDQIRNNAAVGNRSIMQSLSASGMSPNRAAAVASRLNAQGLTNANSSILSAREQQQRRGDTLAGSYSQILSQDALNRAQQRNQTRENRNSIFGNLGNLTSNYFTGLNQLASTQFDIKTAIEAGAASQTAAAYQNMMNSIAMGASAYGNRPQTGNQYQGTGNLPNYYAYNSPSYYGPTATATDPSTNPGLNTINVGNTNYGWP